MKPKYLILLAATITSLLPTACEDKIDPLLTELEVNRAFSPTGLTARIRNLTSIELSWNHRNDAQHYVVEFSQDSLEFTNIILTRTVMPDEIPIQETFGGDTRYSARVKAVSNSGKADSKWATVTIRTEPENIFLPLPGGARPLTTQITLKWQPGSNVSHILINPGNIERTVSEAEKNNGEAVITGLTPNTVYTFTIFNGLFNRGVMQVSTLKEANVTPADDLLAIINTAPDGAELVLAPGTYVVGLVDLTKAITIEGQDPYDPSYVQGNFTCASAVTSVTLKRIKFTPDGTVSQFFNALVNAQIGTLTISECEISGYTNSFISSTNTSSANGKFGNIIISNCYVHDILPATGGDGLDFRAAGAVTNLTVENSTFANSFRSFLRLQATANVIFRNCTFYKLCVGGNVNDSNNTGLFRITGAGSMFEVRNCLFAETGRNDATDPLRGGVWTRAASNMNVEAPVYANNNVFNCFNIFAGLYTSASQVAATETEPLLEDPVNGNFRVNSQALKDRNVGDPKWLY